MVAGRDQYGLCVIGRVLIDKDVDVAGQPLGGIVRIKPSYIVRETFERQGRYAGLVESREDLETLGPQVESSVTIQLKK